MPLARFAFQACSFNHSDISPSFGARRRRSAAVPSGGSLKRASLAPASPGRSVPLAV